MVVQNESTKPKVRPKLKSNASNEPKVLVKSERKHRLKQRFEVLKKLGQGTYGKVQLAINKETGQEVAIKTIKKSKVESEQDLVRIRREIQIMSSIQHPHIIHIYEVFENKDKIVLVMQYASGGEVYDYVSDRKVLNDSEARRVFRQIATAIYYCHKNKICHRDLKLENILLDEKGNAKIADFGLSNVFDERHYLQTFCGSPLYASPEIVKGSPYYGPEVDCWSLGVLLYTLVYGAMPFDGSNFKRLVKQITESNYFEPKQKSDASALIKRLLTPNPTERATIIDICTDWWVNRGYEHSLLQVSEDMANLTPVRLDILLALAPVSPSADKLRANPFDANEVENKATNDENNENLNELANDVNTNDNSLKKRQANPSFDQSLAAVPSQTPKKKKPKKSESKLIEDNLKDNNQTNGQQRAEEVVQQNDASICDIKSVDVLENDEQMPQKDDLMSDITENKEQIDVKSVPTDPVVIQSEDNCKSIEPKEKILDSKEETDNELKTNSNVISKPIESEIKSKQTNEGKIENEDKVLNEEMDIKTNNENKVLNENIMKTETKTIEQKSESKSDENKTETTIESKDGEKKKVKRDRSSSAKRPGKLSIPNIWNKSFDTTENQTPSESRRDSQVSEPKTERKAPFIPIGFRVSDAKRAFERRCSVPTNTLYQSFNKRRDSKISEDIVEEKHKNVRQRAPKLNTRSLSCNEMLESPKKVKEINEIVHKIDINLQKTDDIKGSVVNTDSSQVQAIPERVSPMKDDLMDRNESTGSPVLNKDMAKDILKKSIAKAKLMEKRQTSNDSSPTTTPLVSIENSDVSILSEPSLFRKARPFVKEESDKPTVNLILDIDIKPKGNESKESVDSKPINTSIERVISSELNENSSEAEENEKLDLTSLPEQTKATPIARSYKKVTFTKDGACITETGKIYSSEGTDGSYTRVEKKSKVTHFPSVEEQSNQSQTKVKENSIQRSDSQSSSGSLDIFDDIFDNHWCGESIFPNMKSLFKGVVGNRMTRRRSRAESCERNNTSDWFSSRRNPSAQSDHESETEDNDFGFSRSLWPKTKPNDSIFDKFSKHFKDLDKDFGIFDDSGHSFRDMNRSISRDRTSFSSRIHPTSFKVIFGPQTSVRSTTDNLETDDGYGNASKSSLNNCKNKSEDNPRLWSREPESLFCEPLSNLRKVDSFDSSRRRVEQWLESDKSKDNIEKTPLSMYATVGPRGVRRYLRTISGRLNDKQNDETLNSSSSLGGFGSSQHSNANHSSQSSTIPNDSVIEMRFSLNPNFENNSNITSNRQTNRVCEPSECSDDYQSSIVLPESSSLLEQLRTHGYRNIVSQRLSGSSLFSDLDSSIAENDKTYKRGKSVLNCSSGVLNDNANACECMDETNLTATSSANTSAATSEAAIDRKANINNDLKASDSLSFANRLDIDSISETLNHSFNQTVDQQSCDTTSRCIANNSKTSVTDELPECNPTLKPDLTSNKNVNNFKESVSERIHRKSFYSRFNDNRPVLTTRHRRRSFIDDEDVGLAFGSKTSSSLSSRSSSFRNSLSLDEHNLFSSKPPSSSSDWFNRMESRASQLMDDLLSNDRMSSFNHHFRDNDIQENGFSFGSRRRSSSSTRSAFSTPRSHKSDIDSYVTNGLSNSNEETNGLNSLLDELRSPTEVLRKAIDLLSEKN